MPSFPDIYPCGFVQAHATQKEWAQHIQACAHPVCEQIGMNYADLRNYWRRRFGDGTLPPDKRAAAAPPGIGSARLNWPPAPEPPERDWIPNRQKRKPPPKTVRAAAKVENDLRNELRLLDARMKALHAALGVSQ